VQSKAEEEKELPRAICNCSKNTFEITYITEGSSMNAWADMFLHSMLKQSKKISVFLSLLKATLATEIH